jgi:Domain of unknown function (DUF4390)
MTGRPLLLLAAVWLAAGGPAFPADEVKVTTVVSDRRVLASFVAQSAWTADAREVIKSGLVLTFSFDVELRRPSTIWFDSTLAHVRVASSVKFDSLTGTYQLKRLRDGHVVQSFPSDQEPQVRDWMTAFNRVALEPEQPLEANAEYYVRVRLYASPRRTVSLWSIWPFGHDDGSGRADFTVIR